MRLKLQAAMLLLKLLDETLAKLGVISRRHGVRKYRLGGVVDVWLEREETSALIAAKRAAVGEKRVARLSKNIEPRAIRWSRHEHVQSKIWRPFWADDD